MGVLDIGVASQLSSVDGARMRSVEDGLVRSHRTSVEVVEIGSADEDSAAETEERSDGPYRAATTQITGETSTASVTTVGARGQASIAVTLPRTDR